MSTVNPLELPGRRPIRYEGIIKVTSFEKVTSFLFALNFLIGLFVIAMFFMFLGTVHIVRIEPVPIVMVEPKPPGDNPKGYEEDVEAPGLEESQDFTEPRIEETFLAV
ncbi:MAG TPA: hypothetical protein DCO70_02060, partial [Verrucomicrobiales bacterium]|nr:hypothetical protein [Verrucomicrobiales bacterium]